MTIHSFLFLSLIVWFTSCHGQTANQVSHQEPLVLPVIGDTVNETGKNIMVIYQDKKNNYWFGSWEDGLYKYDGTNLIHFTAKHGLPHHRIDDIKEDKDGNIYFNTIKGICKYDGHTLTTLHEAKYGTNLWKLSADDLWFKSSEFSGYVFRYDGQQLHHLKLPTHPLGEDFVQKHPTAHSPYAVYCIYQDSKGNVWFGTSLLGALRYDGRTFDWITEKDVTELHDGPANGVRSILEDKDGYFWFNADYRYAIYDSLTLAKGKPDGQFYRRIKSIGSLDGKKDGNLNEYLSITQDNDQHLWFVTYRSGVWKYNGERVIHYPVKVNSEDIPLFYIHKDRQDTLWLGTHENGVFKFNGQTFEQFRP